MKSQLQQMFSNGQVRPSIFLKKKAKATDCLTVGEQGHSAIGQGKHNRSAVQRRRGTNDHGSLLCQQTLQLLLMRVRYTNYEERVQLFFLAISYTLNT